MSRRKLLAGGFSKDRAQVYVTVSKHLERGHGVATARDRCKDRRGEDARRRRWTQAGPMAGFSLHPDRFLTSLAKWPCDIWMLEGFGQMPRKTWLDRLLRSLVSTLSPGLVKTNYRMCRDTGAIRFLIE